MRIHKLKLGSSRFVVNPKLPDLKNDPVIKRKAESCRKMLIKAGLPVVLSEEEKKEYLQKAE